MPDAYEHAQHINAGIWTATSKLIDDCEQVLSILSAARQYYQLKDAERSSAEKAGVIEEVVDDNPQLHVVKPPAIIYSSSPELPPMEPVQSSITESSAGSKSNSKSPKPRAQRARQAWKKAPSPTRKRSFGAVASSSPEPEIVEPRKVETAKPKLGTAASEATETAKPKAVEPIAKANVKSADVVTVPVRPRPIRSKPRRSEPIEPVQSVTIISQSLEPAKVKAEASRKASKPESEPEDSDPVLSRSKPDQADAAKPVPSQWTHPPGRRANSRPRLLFRSSWRDPSKSRGDEILHEPIEASTPARREVSKDISLSAAPVAPVSAEAGATVNEAVKIVKEGVETPPVSARALRRLKRHRSPSPPPRLSSQPSQPSQPSPAEPLERDPTTMAITAPPISRGQLDISERDSPSPLSRRRRTLRERPKSFTQFFK